MAKKTLRRRTLKRRTLKRSRKSMKRRNTLKRSRKSMKRRNTLKRSRKSMKRRRTFGGLTGDPLNPHLPLNPLNTSIEDRIEGRGPLHYSSIKSQTLSWLPKSILIIDVEREGSVVKYIMNALPDESITVVPLYPKRYSEFLELKNALKTKVDSLNTELKQDKKKYNSVIVILDRIKNTINNFPTVGTWKSKIATLSDEVIEQRKNGLNSWLEDILSEMINLHAQTEVVYGYDSSTQTNVPIVSFRIGEEITGEFLKFLNAKHYP